MFIRETSEVEHPFDEFAHRFAAPDWLHPLAIAAVTDALRSTHDLPSEALRPPAIAVWPDAFHYELGPVRVSPREVTVAMRWDSRLPAELFPELFDGDLRVERADGAFSGLSVVGTYPNSTLTSVEPGAVKHVAEAWARGFLTNIVHSLPEDPPF